MRNGGFCLIETPFYKADLEKGRALRWPDNGALLRRAVQNDNLDEVKRLLDAETDVNAKGGAVVSRR